MSRRFADFRYQLNSPWNGWGAAAKVCLIATAALLWLLWRLG